MDTDKYLHALAFSPMKDIVAVIFLDMTELKEAEIALVEKEKLLVEYRQELRHLSAEISIAEERSRRKFSTKLHDHIGYSLLDLMNNFRNLSRYIEENGDSFLRKWVESSFADAEALLHMTRSLTLEIGSPLLYEVGLEAALESLAERMLTHRNIAFDFRQSGPKLDIDVNNRILIYQMTQELLLNVIKHSKASHVILDVRRGKRNIRVLVEDNGCGFLADRKQHWGKLPGIGLFSIRERLHYIGGKLRILSEKGKGCSVLLIASAAGGENEK